MPPEPSAFLRHLARELDRRRDAGLLRTLHAYAPRDGGAASRAPDAGDPGPPLLNLASNDYLGLSRHPRLIDAAVDATKKWGVGSGASRLVTGTRPLHREAERAFAAFKHAPAALLCPTGYMANLAVLATLARPGDLLCADKLNHASLLDAAHASGATLRVYPHLDTRKLERLLDQHAREARDAAREHPDDRPPQRFIVTDSIFSMDGDCADLPALAALRDRYDAVLVVDEAHGTGVLGATGAGLAEHQGVAGKIDITISTASKALGSLGGIVTAPGVVIDTLVNAARSFIYTTAVPPAQAASILAALEVVRDEPERRAKLADLSRAFRGELASIESRSNGKVRTLPLRADDPPTPIIPLIVGDERAALALASHLESRGLLAPAIRPPTVPRGASRVRVTLRADLEPDALPRLVDALRDW